MIVCVIQTRSTVVEFASKMTIRHYSGDQRPHSRERLFLVGFRLPGAFVDADESLRVSNATHPVHNRLPSSVCRIDICVYTTSYRVHEATARAIRYSIFFSVFKLFLIVFRHLSARARAFVYLTSVYTTRTIKHVRRRPARSIDVAGTL